MSGVASCSVMKGAGTLVEGDTRLAVPNAEAGVRGKRGDERVGVVVERVVFARLEGVRFIGAGVAKVDDVSAVDGGGDCKFGLFFLFARLRPSSISSPSSSSSSSSESNLIRFLAVLATALLGLASAI